MEKKILTMLKTDNTCVLITVFQNTGAVQLEVGTKMLVSASKTISSLDDGPIDKLALKAAHEALEQATSSLVYYDLSQSNQLDIASTSGTIGLFIEYIDYSLLPLFESALQAQEKYDLVHWLVDLSDSNGYKRILQSDPKELLTKLNRVKLKPLKYKLGRELLKHSALLLKNDTKTFYVEPLKKVSTVLICGSGRLSMLIAKLAHYANFHVDIVEDNQKNANYTQFPHVKNIHIVPEYKNIIKKCAIGSHHYILILTQEYKHINVILSQVLHSKASYIGLSANIHRKKYLFKKIKELGTPETELACIHCPIGINIGAKNTQETAFSIIAELIAARAGRLPRIKDL